MRRDMQHLGGSFHALEREDLAPRDWIPHSGWAIRFDELARLPLADGMAPVGVQLSEGTQCRERLLNTYLTFDRHWSDHAAQAYQSFVHSIKILLRKGCAGRRFSWSGANLGTVPELIYLLAPCELVPHACTARRSGFASRSVAGFAILSS